MQHVSTYISHLQAKLRTIIALQGESMEAIHPRKKGKLQRDRRTTQPTTTTPRKPATASQN